VIAPEEVDIVNAAELRAALLVSAAHGPGTFAVDMSQTRFCDTAGLHALVRAHQRAQADRGKVVQELGHDALAGDDHRYAGRVRHDLLCGDAPDRVTGGDGLSRLEAANPAVSPASQTIGPEAAVLAAGVACSREIPGLTGLARSACGVTGVTCAGEDAFLLGRDPAWLDCAGRATR
jgi:hypothetical protein